MNDENFVIGVDYGTDSVRTIIADASDGKEVASSVYYYPRWKTGLYCDPARNRFRQHPLDHIEGLEQTIADCVKKAGPAVASRVRAISVDTTGSTPVPVDKTGTPLALLPAFAENPNAMFVLWKDHTSIPEAEAINLHAKDFPVDYLQYVGGIYSSEWFWAKLLHVLREDQAVRGAIHSWVEHCDWIPFLLTGGRDVAALKRGICASGHKALWCAEFGGFPPNDFFASLDPLLDGFTDKLAATETFTASEPAGVISPEWAHRLGLDTGVVIGIGAMDAHMGAVGGQIEPYFLSKVMGTSTCDMLVAPPGSMKGILVRGICGQVDGSVIPGMIGMEAGQSAFGDAYAWFRNLLMWPVAAALKEAGTDPTRLDAVVSQTSDRMIARLSETAALLGVHEEDEMAIDWFNGRRTPDADQSLKGALAQLNLASDAPRVFRAVAESTCFGARAIVDRFIREGIPVKGLIGLGGVARKSTFIMQMMADIMNMPIRIHRSEQTCAAGAAMFAATAAGLYSKVEDAMEAMGQGFDMEYKPDPLRAAIYGKRYLRYQELGGLIEKFTA